MKTVLIGSVFTSRRILETMIEMDFPISYVFSLAEEYSQNVSGYEPIHKTAMANGIPCRTFKKINDEENVQIIEDLKPDYIFVIGLSQLVSQRIIGSASKGVIGFHPAPLPKFRGRASNVWQHLLGVRESKCSLFFIDEGVDSGDILGQETYYINDGDYAEDVCNSMYEAEYRLVKRVLKEIMDGTLKPIRQNEDEATYTLKRTPEDGLIDWSLPCDKLHLFIRAVSRPYPGAFGMYDGKHKVIIYRADLLPNDRYIGFNGQIAKVDDDHFDVLCEGGLLRVTDYENVDEIRLIEGHRFR